MGKRIFSIVALLGLLVVLAVWGGWTASAGPTASNVGDSAQASVASAQPMGSALAVEPGFASAGAMVTQTFTLAKGWNAIYLEVEPINTSTLVNVGTAEEPLMAPELSTMEAVFAPVTDGGGLDCTDCLDSVWMWNTPLSTMDYIIDPSEGLWDVQGWKRYFPANSVDENGVSRDFLTNLLSLHANTAYLVKLNADAKLTVTGRPVVQHHKWQMDSYNLAGFPVQPGANPTVATFFPDLLSATSPVTETRRLDVDGTWGPPLAPNDTLSYGEAYLVYYSGANADAPKKYTAPLNIMSNVGDGLTFASGSGGNEQTVRIENLGPNAVQVALQLQGDGEVVPAVALKFDNSTAVLPLWPDPVEITLASGQAVDLPLVVMSVDQPTDGEALLEISSAELGTRWLIPVTAKSGSRAGLWVGEVTVNDVSESRLGATNVAEGTLSISLRTRNGSGISGAAELGKVDDTTTALTVTLALPAQALAKVHDTPPFTTTVSGYVYQDLDQNGQRGGDEPGFAGVTVNAGGQVTTTALDGFYAINVLDQTGNPTVSIDTTAYTLTNYTPSFSVTLPITTTGITITMQNQLPAAVNLEDGIIKAITPRAYMDQALGGYVAEDGYELPYYDSNDDLVTPSLNFGYVTDYQAVLYEGKCGDPLPSDTEVGQVINGNLVTTTVTSLTTLVTGYAIAILDASQPAATSVVACGDTTVSTPAQPVTFRVILRVAADGRAELLPYYNVVTDTQRISAANFSVREAVADSNGTIFSAPNTPMQFIINIGSNDPLNPFKHKYHPDHDNLTRQFLPFPADVQPYQLEAPNIRRSIKMNLTTELSDLAIFGPPTENSDAEIAALAADLDWGGATWGGTYEEVMSGLHKNDITVGGYFIIRHVLTEAELIDQDYD